MSYRPIVLAALLVPSLTGCMPDIEEEAATAIVQSALQSAQQQSTARGVTEVASDDCSMTAEEMAVEAAAAPVVGLYPSSCVTKTADGTSVHADYDHCTTVFGDSDISGGLDATLESTGACTHRAAISDSGNLTDHDKAYSYLATADITVRPGERDVLWNASWQGTTQKDQAIAQTEAWHFVYTLSSGCYAFDGTAEGKLGETPYDYEIADLSICEDQCPSQGTVLAHWDSASGEGEMSVEFDGSDVAKVIGWTGREFRVEMVCSPATEPEAAPPADG
jgi:hypothetical protein